MSVSSVSVSGGKDARGAREKKLVLIVEDSIDNRELYAAMLSRRGYDTIEAEDGLSALQVAEQQLPDVIIMDLSLPDIDGLEAIHRLRASEVMRDIPVIVVSGDSSVFDNSRPVREWDAFLIKPCMPDDLAAAVERVLKA